MQNVATQLLVPAGTIYTKVQANGTINCYFDGDTLPEDFAASTVLAWTAQSFVAEIGTTAWRAMLRDAFDPLGDNASLDMVGLMITSPTSMQAGDAIVAAAIDWLAAEALITAGKATELDAGSSPTG